MFPEMFSKLLDGFTLEPIALDPEFQIMKTSGMTFTISAARIPGVAHVSVMQAKGFFGLMKMDSFIVVPFGKDMPLMSYDRIHAMGNDKLYLEFYQTTLSRPSLAKISALKKTAAGISDANPGESWYKSLLDEASTYKAGRKKDSPAIDRLSTEMMKTYFSLLRLAGPCDETAKTARNSEYVEGLLTNGGPSTNAFIKAHGKEKTARLFREYLFGTGRS